MMTWIFAIMIILSVIFSILTGQIGEVSAAAVNQSAKAIELMLTLMGTMCFWSGIMRVADEAGLTEKLSRLFSPILLRLFKGVKKNSPALKAISMNIAANLLGLGNAATPLGIAAMQELNSLEHNPKSASDNMILFVVLNTASLQLIPTTAIMLRQKAGSIAPMEIMLPVWLASLASITVGVTVAKLFSWRAKNND